VNTPIRLTINKTVNEMALDSAAEIFSIENFGIRLQSNAEVVQRISADSLQNAFQC